MPGLNALVTVNARPVTAPATVLPMPMAALMTTPKNMLMTMLKPLPLSIRLKPPSISQNEKASIGLKRSYLNPILMRASGKCLME